jgi:hypothetical protein
VCNNRKTWDWVQANLFSHYFLSKKDIGIVRTVGLWQQWHHGSCLLVSAVGSWQQWDCYYSGIAVRIWGESQTVFCHCYIYYTFMFLICVHYTQFICVSNPVSFEWHIIETMVKVKDVHLGERTLCRLLILLLSVWVQVQAKLCPHYFCKKGIVNVTAMGWVLWSV